MGVAGIRGVVPAVTDKEWPGFTWLLALKALATVAAVVVLVAGV